MEEIDMTQKIDTKKNYCKAQELCLRLYVV